MGLSIQTPLKGISRGEGILSTVIHSMMKWNWSDSWQVNARCQTDFAPISPLVNLALSYWIFHSRLYLTELTSYSDYKLWGARKCAWEHALVARPLPAASCLLSGVLGTISDFKIFSMLLSGFHHHVCQLLGRNYGHHPTFALHRQADTNFSFYTL